MTITKCAERIRSVGLLFSRIGLEEIEKFELSDPQFSEALRIAEVCDESAPALLGLNATVAYMLGVRGEEFWHSFSDYCIRRCGELNVFDLVIEFTRTNNLFSLKNKLRRLDRLRSCPDLPQAIDEHNLIKYWNLLAECLGSDRGSKTVVFSVKMVYYGLRALGINVDLPHEAPIPVDRRISLLSVSSGMTSFNGCRSEPIPLRRLRRYGELIMRKPELVREVWWEVSRISKIPPLHIDAPLWVIGRYLNFGSRGVIYEELIKSQIGRLLSPSLLKTLINELYNLLPP